MDFSSEDEPNNEWMRAYLVGEEPPSVDVPNFFLTGLPLDTSVWLDLAFCDLAFCDVIGIPTNASYITLGVSGLEHVLERSGSSEQT